MSLARKADKIGSISSTLATWRTGCRSSVRPCQNTSTSTILHITHEALPERTNEVSFHHWDCVHFDFRMVKSKVPMWWHVLQYCAIQCLAQKGSLSETLKDLDRFDFLCVAALKLVIHVFHLETSLMIFKCL